MPDAKPTGIVNRIGSFFLTVVKSCYDMEWYRKVRARPWTAALRYSAGFQAALVLFVTAGLASQLFGAETAFIVHLQKTFPENAALQVSAGHLSTNLPQPFEAGSKWIRVVIDTTVEGAAFPDKYKDFDGILVGKDAVFMPKPGYASPPSIVTQQRVYRMEDFSEFSVTKAQLLSWLQVWGGPFILGALVMFALTYWALLMVTAALYVGVTAGLAFVLGWLSGIRMTYWAWVAVGLHAVTLPLLLNYAMTAADFRIPLAFSFVYFMFVVAVIADERSQPVTPDAGPVPPGGPPAHPRTRKIAARKPPRKQDPSSPTASGPDDGTKA